MSARGCRLVPSLVLAIVLAACAQPPPVSSTTPGSTAAGLTPTVPTRTTLASATVALRDRETGATQPISTPPAATPTPTSPGPTPRPTVTPTPTPELLACPDAAAPAASARPLRLLYTNADAVWLWDEASGTKTAVPLPDGATAPRVSDDGRFVAFLIREQSHDTPTNPVPSIPLWLLDRETGQVQEVAAFDTTETRQRHPDAPAVLLHLDWLPGGHRLLVQVFPTPSGTGILHPTGDLFLVDAATGARQLLLRGGQYEYYSIRPDGRQIAAVDTAARSEAGTANWDALQDGALILVDVPAGTDSSVRRFPVRLPDDVWAIRLPAYSPGGAYATLPVEAGFAILDTEAGALREVPFENTCRLSGGCSWNPALPVYWLPDEQSFVTFATISDYFDERAETTIAQVHVEPALSVETVTTVHANPHTFELSPDRRYLSYWNQPDTDTLDAGLGLLNWVSFYLMDLRERSPAQYAEGRSLRGLAWGPDGEHFLYGYAGERLVLGSVCRAPRTLPVPAGRLPIPAQGYAHGEVQWLGSDRFLLRTLPAEGTPSRYPIGLYLYTIDMPGQPLHIDDLIQDGLKPYGTQLQVIVLQE